MTRERVTLGREKGSSGRQDAATSGGLRKRVEFGEEEDTINVFQTCPDKMPCVTSHKLSDKVAIKSQGHKSLAATQSGPLSLLKAF